MNLEHTLGSLPWYHFNPAQVKILLKSYSFLNVYIIKIVNAFKIEPTLFQATLNTRIKVAWFNSKENSS